MPAKDHTGEAFDVCAMGEEEELRRLLLGGPPPLSPPAKTSKGKMTSLRTLMSRRTRGLRLLVLLNVFLLAYLCSLLLPAADPSSSSSSSSSAQHLGRLAAFHPDLAPSGGGRHADDDGGPGGGWGWGGGLPPPLESLPPLVPPLAEVFHSRRLLANKSENSNYPTDVFSLEERRKGAVVLHVIGMVYMFVALAVVCDEFFVPALTVITERLKLTEDVAGATFMAAGGSAPELFTSIIGVFISENDVGIGTIVGSAVFNILFVIGMCALFSKELLHLTWWPLFRDVTWYSISLILLIVFFVDDHIYWWEATILFVCYFSYVVFMKFNHNIESKVKSCLKKKKTRVQSSDQLIEGNNDEDFGNTEENKEDDEEEKVEEEVMEKEEEA